VCCERELFCLNSLIWPCENAAADNAAADNAAADNAAGICPTMWPVYTAPPAGTSRDDAGHVGGLGGGRGALEALIARSAASASAGASAAAAEESPAAEATPAHLEVEIAYTRQPSSAARCGARAGAGGFSLLESTFRKQHGAIPCDFDPSSLGWEPARLPSSDLHCQFSQLPARP